MAHTLHQLGYLEKCPDTRRYALGLSMLDFSFQFVRTHPLVEVATPHLIELRRSCEERVDMSLFDGRTLVYAIRLQSKREKFYTTLVGRRMPVFCSAGGRAMLARLPEDRARHIIDTSDRSPLTSKSITEPAAIMKKIHAARIDGYSVAVEESILGEITLGAPIVNAQGLPVGAVHIAGSIANWNPETMVQRLLPGLLETVNILNGRAP
jgi:DNA-binding IclR family transcriptional regulator